MTYLNTRQKELFREFANMADKVCNLFYDCKDCPFSEYPICPCVAIHEKEPSREDLPIDIDDYHCDECCHPISNGCDNKDESECPYGLGECCEDNLATNVGRICFEHNVSTNVAMALIEIIKKERDRNEYLHLYREHFPAE